MSKRYPIFDLEGPNTVQLTLEQRYETLESIFVHQLFQLYRIIGRRYGWEAANEILLEVPSSAVPLIAKGYQRKFGLEGEGAALISQVMQAEFQAEGSDVAVLEESREKAVFEVDCSFGGMLQSGTYDDVKITPGLCDAGCADWMGEVGATVDPPVEAERETWMGDGAPRCRFCLRARESDGSPTT